MEDASSPADAGGSPQPLRRGGDESPQPLGRGGDASPAQQQQQQQDEEWDEDMGDAEEDEEDAHGIGALMRSAGLDAEVDADAGQQQGSEQQQQAGWDDPGGGSPAQEQPPGSQSPQPWSQEQQEQQQLGDDWADPGSQPESPAGDGQQLAGSPPDGDPAALGSPADQAPSPADGASPASAAAHLAQQEEAVEHEQAQQRRLNELEAQLRQPDAVMEPGVMERLREYVLANGHPKAAVEHLTDSYTGYAQMASLVCRWLQMTEPDEPLSGGPAPGASAPAADGAAGGGGGHDGQEGRRGAQQGAQRAQQLDEAFYLRQLAKERFDPALFATIFTSGGSGAPQWISGLIEEPEGRSLVYELAGRYKNSLLLNYAIHKILIQPGREREVAAVGGSLTGYFGVFHRLMAAKLREAASAPDERSLAALTQALKSDACASQHTYVHAQQVLGELGRHPNGARFRRISQELEEHAAALHGPVVWKMRQWFAEPGQPEQHYLVAGLLSDILASSVSGAPPASEMGKLYRLYWPQESDQQPPPVAFLRHPRVFEVLLQGLFNPARQLPPETVQAYSGLLALAAAADDRRDLSGPATGAAGAGGAQNGQAAGGSGKQDQQQQQQQGEAGGKNGSAEHGSGGEGGREAAPGGGGGSGAGALDLSAVPATRAALESAAELAQRVMQDQKGRADDLEVAASVLEYPCCAAGLLKALGAQLTRQEYWQTAYHLLRSPPFLAILSLLVPRQPALHEALLQLLGRSLAALGNSNHDMAKGFLSIAVQLVSAGRVFEVLRWAEEWKQRADPSLVRHLVFGILEVSAPPYSPDFAGSMLRIMMAAGIRRQRLSTRDWAIKALLDEFAAACAQVQFKPPLSAREAQFLQDIGADRPPGY